MSREPEGKVKDIDRYFRELRANRYGDVVTRNGGVTEVADECERRWLVDVMPGARSVMLTLRLLISEVLHPPSAVLVITPISLYLPGALRDFVTTL